MKLGLLAAGAVAALVAGLLLVAQVQAVSGTVGISDGEAAPGGSASVELTANVGDPGLGAWTLDISYDVDVASVGDCEPEEGGVCNPAFADGVVRITGASANGLDGDTLLGTITFDCADAEGVSDLTIAVSVFSDATIGAPAEIDETVSNGTLTCAEPEPTVVVAGSPTKFPDVGTGYTPSDSDGSLGWVIAGLAGAGLAAIAGFGALRLRTRRS